MSIQAHLAELEKRHQSIAREIEEKLAQPASDDLQIAELKRRKLAIKDAIEKLRGDTLSVH
ncbi:MULTISPECIES: YdcH family protein [Blastochloris]|uniref:DUF465 domain-containing protein n=2 Tax=Blastochloris TaxID=59282 RepID=A0A348G4Y1_9HYPH|nr:MULTISPECIES: DUF465 domain-containing protein [Blastochloris]KAA5601203.1 DUF465 domain-containing protein [Blastochloris sulfoviridis]BBF94614.1 hypothetical protein BLTE_32990 [Blastochloris tepida]